jgi:hypothetical protein
MNMKAPIEVQFFQNWGDECFLLYGRPYQKKRHTAQFSLAGYSGFSAGQNH